MAVEEVGKPTFGPAKIGPSSPDSGEGVAKQASRADFHS